jgi:hypothetical protein
MRGNVSGVREDMIAHKEVRDRTGEKREERSSESSDLYRNFKPCSTLKDSA